MQLRNGKVIKSEEDINTSKKEKVIAEIKSNLEATENVPMGDMPGRIRGVRSTFMCIFNNIDFLMSPEFDEPEKSEMFITTVYKKIFTLRREVEWSVTEYMSRHKDVKYRDIYRVADELTEVLDEVQNFIEMRRPDFKTRM